MDDDKIVIIDESESPFKPDRRSQVVKAGQKVVGTVARTAVRVIRRVWNTDARRAVTRTAGKGVAKAAQKGRQAAQNAAQRTVEKQMKETDWKRVAQTTAASGLRRAGVWVGKLAERLQNTNRPNDGHPPPPN